MSSHREAPEISKDPVADNTDTYAFVSPDNPGAVTIITNYIPLENPAGGPNFFEFGDDVLYSIYIDNDGDARPDITYQFRFSSQLRNPDTFLYNTGPINSLDDPNWNKRQFYDVTKVVASTIRPYPTLIGDSLASPPCNIGPRSTPSYATLAQAAVHTLPTGETVFIWGAASRQAVQLIDGFDDSRRSIGPWAQVSRLGNPLFNEVIVPLGKKDQWNATPPSADGAFAQYVKQPELARLLPVLYPGVFPNLAKLTADRADLVAILLTGIPPGVVPGCQNFTGNTPADMLRLNVAIPPASKPSPLGLLGGDVAGFPNGWRVFDDVVTIELRAIAGATYLQSTFPYLGLPHDGFSTPSS